MSLLGIDIGSSAVKGAVYSNNGRILGSATSPITQLHPGPGLWETDPLIVWKAVSEVVQNLTNKETIQKDPPLALALCASGRENFPADKNGTPLGNGIMGADIRGEEFEILPSGINSPESWCLSCGHLRERMDPIFRLEWWKKYKPEVIDRAHYFFGWIDYIHFMLTGHDVMDRATASRYAIYDLANHSWNSSRMATHNVDESILPEVLPWGSIVGQIKKDVADKLGLPAGVLVAQGCHDVNCAAFGAGVVNIGTACLVSGSYENLLAPTQNMPTANMLTSGLSVMPHPCEAGFSVLAVHPTGSTVLNWVRSITKSSISALEKALMQNEGRPSPVIAIPFMSGAMTYWKDGRKARGGILSMTLSTTKEEIVQAFMESISYDVAISLNLLKSEGENINRIRITGGGSRSKWWNQLKADISGMPVEVVTQPEPGTWGAALLAGLALGQYSNMEEASITYSGTKETYIPSEQRSSMHQERFEKYQETMAALLSNVY